jgi:hypothetical protein
VATKLNCIDTLILGGYVREYAVKYRRNILAFWLWLNMNKD